MNLHTPTIARLYQQILQTGEEGVERYRAALRARGFAPVPDPTRPIAELYATNPVLLPGRLIDAMVADANTFCDALRRDVPDGLALLERMPQTIRDLFASAEVAERVVADLRGAHPLTSIDAFLVQTEQGIDRAYLEWQTVGSYLTQGRWVMECAVDTWPQIAESSTLTATQDLDLVALGERLRAIYIAGIEDDPRQGVILDYLPYSQPTHREFLAIQELTGGQQSGMGIRDPREIVVRDGRPAYLRDGKWIPVRRVYSRLVFSDMLRLLDEASPDERAAMRRLFGDGAQVSWINHPLHFFYGSKSDFPAFWATGLSSGLPECHSITPTFVQEQIARHGAGTRLAGYVQKPTDLQGGRSVELAPLAGDLRPGWVLQREIMPAPYHMTLYGPRTPEVRVMCLPDPRGRLIGGLVFNRVKALDVFLSNAGYTARLNIPGTGEGYGVVVYE